MSRLTERMLQVVAGLVAFWIAWQIAAGTVVQMVNLNLQNRELQRQLKTCAEQVKGAQSSVPHP